MSTKVSVFKKFPRTFWIANTMELFERWGWYGFYNLLANYLTKPQELGALSLSMAEKATIMGVGTMILYFLPVITGTIADRYGYRKVLFAAFFVYITAFLAMPYCKSFESFLLIFIYIAIGGALFKPVITATVSKTTDDSNSSIGFGIYYMMVNIGALIGPVVALQFSKESYNNIFLVSAIVMAINIPFVFFYKEPERNISNLSFGKSLKTIFKNIGIALSDYKFIVFLLIVAGFWSMYYQLFITLPSFIDQWVDTRLIFNWLDNIFPWLLKHIGSADGTIKAEYFIIADSFYIIIFQVLVSTIIMKWKPLTSMTTGFFICSIGMSLTLYTANPFFVLLSLFIFGLGEMAGSPKISEYIGKIAPKDKIALYMGCSFLPVALGGFLAGMIGRIYGKTSDKVVILRDDLILRGHNIPEIGTNFTQTDLYAKAYEVTGMSQIEITEYLWNTYHPNKIWIIILGIGVSSSFLLFLYDRFLIRKVK